MKCKEEIGEDKCDENIIEHEDREGGDDIGAEDLICAPCEVLDGIDADVDVEAEVQQAAVDPGQPIQAQ